MKAFIAHIIVFGSQVTCKGLVFKQTNLGNFDESQMVNFYLTANSIHFFCKKLPNKYFFSCHNKQIHFIFAP